VDWIAAYQFNGTNKKLAERYMFVKNGQGLLSRCTCGGPKYPQWLRWLYSNISRNI